MKPFIYLISAATLFFSLSANAAWTGQQSIYQVRTADSAVYLQTYPASAHINPGGCENKNFYRLDPSYPLFDKHYQALLTALAAGKKVSLEIVGCLGAYPKVRAVSIFRNN
jgi:hypothetical protein